MGDGAVVFVQSVTCPTCGSRSSAYLRMVSSTEGAAVCPRCGREFRHPLPQHYVPQIPLAGQAAYHGRGRMTHYPGLYNRPKEAPRFDLGGMMRAAALPSDAFQRLMVRTDFGHAMIIVLLMTFIGTVVAGVASWALLDELGYYTSNNLWLAVGGALSFGIQIITFFVFTFSAALISKGMFRGRGDYASTATLMGYAFVWSTVFTLATSVVFSTIVVDMISEESDAVTASMLALALLFLIFMVGIVWLLWISARAVSVANDISMGEGILTIIIAALLTGAVSFVMGLFVTLPIGISL